MPRQPVNKNLVPNGDFEIAPSFVAATNTNARYIDGTAGGSTTNNAYGWASISGLGTNTAEFDTTTKYSGAAALKITSTAAAVIRIGRSPNSPPSLNEVKNNHIPALASTSYTCTGRMKTQYVSGDAASGASISIRERNAAGSQVAINGSSAIKTTTDWTFYTVTFTTSSTTAFLSPEFNVTTNDGAGTLVMTAWFDEISITPTTPTTRTALSTPRLAVRNYNAALALATSVATATGLSTLDVSSAGVSFITWLRLRGTATGGSVVEFRNSGGSDRIRMNLETGTNKAFVWQTTAGGSGSLGAKTVAGAIPTNRWIRLGFSYTTGGVSTIYINGVANNSATGNVAGSTERMLIVPTNNTGQTMCDVRVFMRPLTAQEFADDYYNNTMPSGNALWWKIDEGTGTSVADYSGNGFTGTVTSGTWTGDTPMKSRSLVNRNMVTNGDFEYAPPFTAATSTDARWIDGTSGGSTTNKLFGWRVGGSGTFAAQFDTSVKRSGKASMKLSTTATGSQLSIGLGTFSEGFYIPIAPSTAYTFTGWMKTNYVSGDSSNGAAFALLPCNAVGTARTTLTTSYIKTTTDWTLYTISFTSDSTDRFLQMDHRVYGHTGAATLIMDAWFDDIELRPTSPTVRTAVS